MEFPYFSGTGADAILDAGMEMTINRRSEMQAPVAVAIVGASGAGKSWLAERLQDALGKEAARLSLDDFYRDRSHLSPARRERINFDHPRAIDWKLLEENLARWLAGRPAEAPRYDFSTHARSGMCPMPATKAVLLVDGLWLLHRPKLRRLFVLKFFIDAPPQLCLDRRMARDVAERGRTEESVKRQFFSTVLPMYERFVAPQSRWADVVLEHVPRADDVAQLAEQIRSVRMGQTLQKRWEL